MRALSPRSSRLTPVVGLIAFALGCAPEGGGGSAPTAGGAGGVPAFFAGEGCEKLFGVPNERTGLSAEQCAPECQCAGRSFVAPGYEEGDIAALEVAVLENPFAELTADPYAEPELHQPVAGEVCGVIVTSASERTYRLETFASRDALAQASARLTHEDGCGVCSTLPNLAVYMRHPDLTAPVRECGLAGLTSGMEAHLGCLQALGFDRPCAQIWYYNSKHTTAACLAECVALLDAPYHEADGSLNACLVCDEVASGTVFKAVAGRTRRNTGLPSSMCRPCAEVVPVEHQYF